MHHLTFLQDLAFVMIVAALTTVLFRALRQPVVLGYILAGLIIGPHTPGKFITEEGTIQTMAELGVIFLMFSLGLEFSFKKLRKVGTTAFIAASLEILIMVFAGYELGRMFGWSQMDSLFLGAILSISSTTIIIKALEGLGKKNEGFASLIIGILIVEDILAIVMLALLSGFATTGSLGAYDIGAMLVRLGSFLGFLLVAGLIVVPRLVNYVARFKNDEMLLVTVVGLCFGVSLLTVKLGYSVALGAFLIGAIIAESRPILKVESLMLPVRDLFSAVFFVSIGLLIDPVLIIKYAFPILAITIVVVLGKVFACSLGCFISGNDRRTSLKVGMSLAQIGEFSFIIAALGVTLKDSRGASITSGFIYPITVAVSAITTLLTPYLITLSDAVVSRFDRVAPKPLLQGMDEYSTWVGALAKLHDSRKERKIFIKLGLQISVNLLLIAGIFIAAIFLHDQVRSLWPDFPGGKEGRKAALWLLAFLCSFPLLVAVWRKMEVVAMLIAGMSVSDDKGGSRTQALQSIISGVIIVVGTGVLVLLVLALSSAILPSRNFLLLLLLVVLISGILLYRSSVKLYARAQSALHETLADPPDPSPHHFDAGKNLPPMLRDARLVTVQMRPDALAVGKMISELRLRSETGASVVGIDRDGTGIINPPPHEELISGDQVLLIGRPEQLEEARALLETLGPEK